MSFKIKDGVTLKEFMDCANRVRDEQLTKQPGFIERYTAQGEDGTMHMHVLWANESDVISSQEKSLDVAVVKTFMNKMDIEAILMENQIVK